MDNVPHPADVARYDEGDSDAYKPWFLKDFQTGFAICRLSARGGNLRSGRRCRRGPAKQEKQQQQQAYATELWQINASILSKEINKLWRRWRRRGRRRRRPVWTWPHDKVHNRWYQVGRAEPHVAIARTCQRRHKAYKAASARQMRRSHAAHTRQCRRWGSIIDRKAAGIARNCSHRSMQEPAPPATVNRVVINGHETVEQPNNPATCWGSDHLQLGICFRGPSTILCRCLLLFN